MVVLILQGRVRGHSVRRMVLLHIRHIIEVVGGGSMVLLHNPVRRAAAEGMMMRTGPYVVMIGKFVCDRRRALWGRIEVHSRCRALSGTQVTAR